MENVALGGLATGLLRNEALSVAMDVLGLVGLEEQSRTRLRDLSGGERQRVALARALSFGADLILADEPTGALDATTSSQIQTVLRDTADEANVTIVVATHDLTLCAAADDVLNLKNGRIGS